MTPRRLILLGVGALVLGLALFVSRLARILDGRA